MSWPSWPRSSRRYLLSALMGFSAGLPLLLIGGTLKAWLTERGVNLGQIGLFSLVGLPYAFKFIWAPALDRYDILRIGRRRGWLFISQSGVLLGLAALACIDRPETLGAGRGSAVAMAAIATWISFWGATQDTAIDAYRRETFTDAELGLASSFFVSGYRAALLVAGAGALLIADAADWQLAYLAMAALMAIVIVATRLAPEPTGADLVRPKTLRESVVGPLADFFARDGAWLVLAFVLLYKIGESMASEMFNTFYLKLGFGKSQIASVAKVFGVTATVVGGFAGGWLLERLPLLRALLFFGILQSAALLWFSYLAYVGPDPRFLAVAVGSENFASGMATTAYMAFMAIQTNRRFTATQYALLASLVGLVRSVFGSSTGWLAERLGWPGFFVVCLLATLPGLLILWPLRHLPPQTEAI